MPIQGAASPEAAINEAIATFKDFNPDEHRLDKWNHLKQLIQGYNAQHDIDVYILRTVPAEDDLTLRLIQQMGTGPFDILDDSSSAVAARRGVLGDAGTSHQASAARLQPLQPCRLVAGTRRTQPARSYKATSACQHADGPVQTAPAAAPTSREAAIEIPARENNALPDVGGSCQDEAGSHVSGSILQRCQSAAGAIARNVHASPDSLVDRLKDGKEHIFLTGVAGAGKTKFMMDRALPALKKRYKKKLWVTASTGLAAQPVEGKTLHSASDLGRGLGDVNDLISSMPAVSPSLCTFVDFCLYWHAEFRL